MAVPSYAPTADRSLNRTVDPAAPWLHVDVLTIVCTIALSIFGAAAVYSATRGEDPAAYDTSFLERQVAFGLLGVAMMVAFAAIDYRLLRHVVIPGYLVGLLLLVGVLSPLGVEVNGAQAWFAVGPVQLQPSEFMKFAVIVALSFYLARHEGELRLRRLVIALLLVAAPTALILRQPDLGTALVFTTITMGVLLVGGVKFRHVLLLTLAGIIAIIGVVNSGQLEEYQRDRLLTFVDPDVDPQGAGFQQAQAQIAIGNGGIGGKGYGLGTQTRSGLVAEQQTDFIFTVIGEELGFVGGATLLGLYGVLLWRIYRTARVARELLGTLLCVGVLTMFVFQLFQSVGMTTGIMPITGIPLPFISAGGSSLLTSFAGVGIVLNVHMRRFQYVRDDGR